MQKLDNEILWENNNCLTYSFDKRIFFKDMYSIFLLLIDKNIKIGDGSIINLDDEYPLCSVFNNARGMVYHSEESTNQYVELATIDCFYKDVWFRIGIRFPEQTIEFITDKNVDIQKKTGLNLDELVYEIELLGEKKKIK